MAKIEIVGYEKDVNCEHCGRALAHGVRTSCLGVIGTSCFIRMIKENKERFGKALKPSTSAVKDLAKISQYWSSDKQTMNGYYPHVFIFELGS